MRSLCWFFGYLSDKKQNVELRAKIQQMLINFAENNTKSNQYEILFLIRIFLLTPLVFSNTVKDMETFC